MRKRLLIILLTLSSATFAGTNDSGQMDCYNGSGVVECDAPSHPGTDGRYGRDAAHKAGMLAKIGSGQGGFDFTKLDGGGVPLPSAAGVWSCVRDNSTGLVWEAKSDNGGLHDRDWTYAWYSSTPQSNGGDVGVDDLGVGDGLDNCMNTARCDSEKFVQDVNASNLCGYTDWRLPSAGELLDVVSYTRAAGYYIDSTFFDDLQGDGVFWTAETDASYPLFARYVDFLNGDTYVSGKGLDFFVRLVRGAPQ